MPLLAPLFLLGLAAVAVPLLVHLVQREKKDPIAFPSLLFLERTPAPFSARRHIRDPWLFALRAMAIVALVLAFARPVFSPARSAAGSDVRRRDVIVLLDRSFSMRIGERWPRARSAVDSVIRSLAAGDRMTLVAFDRRANAVTASTGDATVLRTALQSLALTDESTRLAPAIAMAQQRLAVSDAPRKAVVVVSDLQRSGWDLTDEARLPTGTEIAVLDVSGTAPVQDRAVRAVDVQPARGVTPPAMIVSARIANVGPAVDDIPVQLEVGGRIVSTRSVNLSADGGANVTFDPVPVPPDPVPARVVLAADALRGDDAFQFLLQQAPALSVLVIEGRASPFLSRALSIGDAPRFDVISRSPSRVSAADLSGRQLVVLSDGAFPTGLGADRLRRFVEEGGGLIAGLGDEFVPRAWNNAAGVLLAGGVAAVAEAGDATIGSVDQRHPALAMLAGPRAGDLSAVRFTRHRAIDTTAGVLARFADGAPALTEHPVGRGRVLTFGSSFDGVWNDLPRQPVFLPLVQQLARYAAGWRDAPRALDIGSTVRPSDLGVVSGAPVTRWVSKAPSGARTTIGGEGAPAVLEITEAGVHEVRPGGSPGARPLLAVANLAPAELDFASYDALRLSSALSPQAGTPEASIAPAEESRADREARQSTWWYLLLAAALLLLTESILARRAVSRTPAVQ